MEQFLCKRCGYSADVKHTLFRHWKRKIKCDPILEDIDVETLMQNFSERDYKINYPCSFCERSFNNKANMYRHTKICKKNPVNIEIESKFQVMQGEIVSLKTKLKEFEYNSINIQNIQNVNTQNIINIHLKDFGLESQEHLSKELLTRCFADKKLVELIENLHFDQNCPQNHNVRLKSKKQELMEIFSNGKWQLKDQDQTLTELIESGYRILRMHGKKNKETIMEEEGIDEEDYNEIIRWLETIYEDKKIQKPVKKDLIILFVNNQTMLLGRDRGD